MSRIDNATLLLNLSTGSANVKLRVYAVNYNVLREFMRIKVNIKYYLLVKKLQFFATNSNCGDSLKLKDTKKYWRQYFGQDKNLGKVIIFLDWKIRSQFLYEKKVQRLNGFGGSKSFS